MLIVTPILSASSSRAFLLWLCFPSAATQIGHQAWYGMCSGRCASNSLRVGALGILPIYGFLIPPSSASSSSFSNSCLPIPSCNSCDMGSSSVVSPFLSFFLLSPELPGLDTSASVVVTLSGLTGSELPCPVFHGDFPNVVIGFNPAVQNSAGSASDHPPGLLGPMPS